MANSSMLYAAPIWIEGKKHKQKLAKVKRKIAMKICRAYKTTSTEILRVLASQMPIDVKAKKKVAKFNSHTQVKLDEKLTQISRKWQIRWDTSANERWTH